MDDFPNVDNSVGNSLVSCVPNDLFDSYGVDDDDNDLVGNWARTNKISWGLFALLDDALKEQTAE